MSDMITVIRTKDQLDAFRNAHPDGYTIMDGDRGIGLIGTYADRARNMGPDPDEWVQFAQEVGPYIHQSSK
jgi:hypothetical protein